jgi:hypothetical protein
MQIITRKLGKDENPECRITLSGRVREKVIAVEGCATVEWLCDAVLGLLQLITDMKEAQEDARL